MLSQSASCAVMPTISVIVPVHNGSKHLGECLESILSQDFRQVEVICIDDASSDESPNILNEWARLDSRIYVLKNAKQQGAGRSRNTGLDAASGQYVLFVDSDDLLAEGALTALIQRAQEDCVSLVRGNLREFSSKNDVTPGESPPVPNRSRIHFSELPQLWVPWGHTACLIERSFLKDSGVRYTSLTLGEDPLFLAQLLTSSDKISTVEHLCYLYRVGHKVDIVTESNLADYITHAKEVKSLFLAAGSERCWVEGYSSVALNGLLYYLDSMPPGTAASRELRDTAREVFSDGSAALDELILERFRNAELSPGKTGNELDWAEVIERGRLDRQAGGRDQLPLFADFRKQGNAPRFQMGGWSRAEAWGTWTVGRRARLLFEIAPEVDGCLVIDFTFANVFLHSQRSHIDVSLYANGHALETWRFDTDFCREKYARERRLRVPCSILTTSGGLLLVLQMDANCSPFDLGLSPDKRPLGLGISTIQVTSEH